MPTGSRKQQRTPFQVASAAMSQSRYVISQIFVPAAAPEAFKKDTQLPRNGATFFPKKSNKEVHHDTPWRSDTLGSVIMTLNVTYVIIKPFNILTRIIIIIIIITSHHITARHIVSYHIISYASLERRVFNFTLLCHGRALQCLR
jgi:hypothetical protein